MRILISAYACVQDPDIRFGNGGEGVLGWNIIRQLSRSHQLWVFTHSQNRKSIEEALSRESLYNAQFYYIELPRYLGFLGKFSGGVQFYAYLWQIKAYFIAKKLHNQFHFDAFHHVTYANDWMASFIGALLPVSYIRGPGGGAHAVPKDFLSEFSFVECIGQCLRAIGQWLFRHDPFFILSQQRAKAILVCNRESLELMPKKWQNKTYLFPVNGVSAEDLNLLKSKKESTLGNKFRILSAGKLLSIKGFNLAIKSFKIFSNKIAKSELKVIGDGPELPNLKNLVRQLGIEGRVQFEKWMPRNEFLKELTFCDIFLFPSLRDGGGAVVIEAMAAGKPVVCLDISGPGFHITNEWGIKIPPSSPEQVINEMAKALEKLYSDKDLRTYLGRTARERAEKFYHWDRLGENLLKIYQEVFKI